MFGSLGYMEILFILVLGLLIFGPRKLPEIGRRVGRTVGQLKRVSDEFKRTLNAEVALEDDEQPKVSRRPANLEESEADDAPDLALAPPPSQLEDLATPGEDSRRREGDGGPRFQPVAGTEPREDPASSPAADPAPAEETPAPGKAEHKGD